MVPAIERWSVIHHRSRSHVPKLRRLILLIGVPVVVGGCSYGCWRSLQPTIGVAADAAHSPVQGLPASATNVRYFLPGFEGPAKAFDFNITESEFEAWMKSLSPPLIANGPGPIHCVDPAHGPDGRHDIANGTVYSWQHEDQAVEAGFDRDIGRAYYYRAYR